MPNRKHDENDRIHIYTGDGDEIVDKKVKQQFNLLLMEDLGWYVPRVQPVPVYRWRDPAQRPIADHRVFAIARETPDPSHWFRFVNDTIIAFYRAASRNQTAQQKEEDRGGNKIRMGIAGGMTLLFILCITVMPLLFKPVVVVQDPNPVPPPLTEPAPEAVPAPTIPSIAPGGGDAQ